MIGLHGDDLIGKAFCDWTLTGIAWTADGIDFDVDLPDTEPLLGGVTAARFICRWLDSAKITVDGTTNPGPALTWDGSVTRTERSHFLLVLDLGGGEVAVECADIELRPRP